MTLGNHETLEMSSGDLKAYHTGKLAQMGMVPKGYDKLYYEYEAGGCHFLVLSQISDTYTLTGYKGLWVHAGDLKKEQLVWLEEKLEAYSGHKRPVFLFIHNSVREVLTMVVIGMSNGAQPVISFNYGAGKKDRVRQGIRFITINNNAIIAKIQSFFSKSFNNFNILFPSHINLKLHIKY